MRNKDQKWVSKWERSKVLWFVPTAFGCQEKGRGTEQRIYYHSSQAFGILLYTEEIQIQFDKQMLNIY